MATTSNGFQNKQDDTERQRRAHGHPQSLALEVERHIKQGVNAEPNPDCEGIERAHIGIVPLTRLQRILVQIDHNGQACQDEQQARHREVSPAPESLENGPYEAQQERQEVVVVVGLIRCPVRRHILPASQPLSIQEVHTSQPVPVDEISMALNVVLPS